MSWTAAIWARAAAICRAVMTTPPLTASFAALRASPLTCASAAASSICRCVPPKTSGS